MNNRRAFTLVELVVASVVVALLATVGVTLYAGFIDESRQRTVDNLAQTAAASANALWRKTGADPANVNALNLFFDNTVYNITVRPPNVRVEVIGREAAFNREVAYR